MSNKDFAVNVAKYFMDFLETNFHKRRTPKRAYKTKNGKNLLVGINLEEFPSLKSKILKITSNNFNSREIPLPKGKYVKKTPNIVLKIVDKYCENLKQDKLNEVNHLTNKDAKELVQEFSHDPDRAKNEILEICQKNVRDMFITPLVERITIPLGARQPDDEDSFIGLDLELSLLFSEILEQQVSEFVINNTGEDASCLNISSRISLEKIKSEIKKYFNDFKIDDLFFKVKELSNNKKIVDKQDLYLYLFDIKSEASTYPPFLHPRRNQ